MRGAYCTEFTKIFKGVNVHFKKSDPKGFDYATLLIYLREVEKGFMVKRINKTTKNGTTVIYKAIESEQDAKKYKELLKAKVLDFNNKWKEEVRLIQ